MLVRVEISISSLLFSSENQQNIKHDIKNKKQKKNKLQATKEKKAFYFGWVENISQIPDA